ncbi:MAG: SDR family NAD(P)-dependent oxidoreductase [Lachnospiraceae bacterium]|nr:SDR family NAD(P)-dependent oxidoreductase [Lachnospiraceae bacterium]
MAKIAIVTGASGGIGRAFTDRISAMENIDEIWAVGRNSEKLEALRSVYPKVVPVSADLSDGKCEPLSNMLKSNSPDVRILINNAGVGYMEAFDKMPAEHILRVCNINCTAPALIMSEVLPYMNEGARVINISSASSFQPNPYLAMYSASKVFLKNLSRAVNKELKSRGITVTSVCPGWVDTGMLPKGINGRKINFVGMIKPERVADKALKDSAKGKDMSVPGLFSKYFRIYSKVTPTRIIMDLWVAIIGKYV